MSPGPDLNSLPPSPSPAFARTMSASNGPEHIAAAAPPPPASPSPPRLASTSLQAAATINAGLQNPAHRSSGGSMSLSRDSSDRRRSSHLHLLGSQVLDPSAPGPGEMVSETTGSMAFRTASPQPLSSSPLPLARENPHHRAPSLGELHQELEQEQEFQVNRLLQMIRQQQLQLQQLQAQQSPGGQSATVTGDDASDRSVPSSSIIPIIPAAGPPAAPATAATGGSSAPHSAVAAHPASAGPLSRSPGFPHPPRSSFDMARAELQRRSRTPSRGTSPRLRSTSISAESGEQWVLGGRDESAFYQAETQMLVRENQMLWHRIRDLERQLSEATGSNVSVTHEPALASHLSRSQSASDEQPVSSRPAQQPESLPRLADAPKEE